MRASLIQQIRSRGAFRYVDSAPESDSACVLLLHGMMGDISNWESTIRVLTERCYRVIVPVLPFYSLDLNRSNLSGQMDYLMDFIEETDLSERTVVGNSLGGQLAVELAYREPEKTRALVLAGASGIFEVDLGSSIMKRRDRSYLRARASKTFFDPAFCTEELLDEVVEIINDREKVVRLIRLARSVQNTSVRDMLPHISVPTRLIWGRHDQITPPDVAETFHSAIPGAELIYLEQCGHAPMIERPEEFNRHLLSFLETHAHVECAALAASR